MLNEVAILYVVIVGVKLQLVRCWLLCNLKEVLALNDINLSRN